MEPAYAAHGRPAYTNPILADDRGYFCSILNSLFFARPSDDWRSPILHDFLFSRGKNNGDLTYRGFLSTRVPSVTTIDNNQYQGKKFQKKIK
jgi:hypothetical protein